MSPGFGTYLRELWKQKPQAYGPPPVVSGNLKDRLENNFGIAYEDCSVAIITWNPGDQIDYSKRSLVCANSGASFERNKLIFSGQYVDSPITANILGSQDFTVVSRVKIDRSRYDNNQIIGLWNIRYNDVRMTAFFYKADTNYKPVSFGTTGTSEPKTTLSKDDSAFNDWATVTLGQQGGVKSININGIDKATISSSYGSSDPINSFIGNSASVDYAFYGESDFVIAFTTALSDDQKMSLHDNPWQLWQKPSYTFYSFADTSIITGTLSASTSMSSSISGKLGVGGGISSETSEAILSQVAQEGKQGSFSSILENTIKLLSGQIGNIGNLTPILLNALFSSTGKLGINGQISTQTSIIAQLFGTIDEVPPTVFEGTLSSVAGILDSELFGKSGLQGSMSSQIIQAASLIGQLGNIGSGTIQLDSISSTIEGILGVSGEITTTISTGADLAGKLGISADLVSSLNDLDLQLVEIVKSDRIYQIIISTKTGQVVFLAPKTGEILFEDPKTDEISITTTQ